MATEIQDANVFGTKEGELVTLKSLPNNSFE